MLSISSFTTPTLNSDPTVNTLVGVLLFVLCVGIVMWYASRVWSE